MKSTYNVYIYGAGNEYNRFVSYLPMLLKYINILGIVTTERQKFKTIDGYPCITVDEINVSEVDYIVIAAADWKNIAEILNLKGITNNKIIRSTVFSLPWFDFNEYIKLKNSDITILSNYCLGGVLYKELGLEILSPTIDMFCAGKDYLEFLRKYQFYLKQEMCEYHEDNYIDGTLGYEYFVPKGILGEKVIWKFNHNVTAEEAITKWKERVKKVNLNNIAVLMTIQSDEDAYAFEEIEINKKIGIYYKDLKLPDIVWCPIWNSSDVKFEYRWNWPIVANDYMSNSRGHFSHVDWLKFFNGRKDYLRFGW